MSEQGSHGGSSPSETTTPIVLLSSAFHNQRGTCRGGRSLRQGVRQQGSDDWSKELSKYVNDPDLTNADMFGA